MLDLEATCPRLGRENKGKRTPNKTAKLFKIARRMEDVI